MALSNAVKVFPVSSANCYLGVGESTNAVADAQADLEGSTKTYKGMETTYPTVATNVNVFRAVFDLAEANNAWEEWGIFNGNNPPTADMLLRKVDSIGTKTSAEAWQLTLTITWLI